MTPTEIDVLARLAEAIEKMKRSPLPPSIDLLDISCLAAYEKVDMRGLALSNQEVIDLTHYRRAAEQLRTLKEMGVPATRLRDNTVRVLRMHLMHPATMVAAPAPVRKSARK